MLLVAVVAFALASPSMFAKWADRLVEGDAVGAPSSAGAGYDRSKFGQAWSDDVTVAGGHNGCDTRNDVLASQLADVRFRSGTRNCVVISGTLQDPYTGKTIRFEKAKASAVQIDHVVALSWAWAQGANTWSDDRRRDFANDPDNLLAVDGPTNSAKSDSSPAAWWKATKQRLPATATGRCLYASRFTMVAAKYELVVPDADRNVLDRLLTDC